MTQVALACRLGAGMGWGEVEVIERTNEDPETVGAGENRGTKIRI